MKNLKVWQKLALLGLILLIPFAVVMWQLISSVRTLSLQPARLEVQGLEYMAPLRKLMRGTQLHRAYSQAVLHGDKNFAARLQSQNEQLEANLKEMDETDARLGGALKTQQQWAKARASCRALIDRGGVTSADQSFTRHGAAVVQLSTLIQHVGDTSTLTLDPEVASYYLMNCIVFLQPKLAENLGQARSVGADVITQKRLTNADRERLLELLGVIRYLASDVANSLQKAGAENKDLPASLVASQRESAAATQNYLRLAESLAQSSTITLSGAQYSDAAITAFDAGYKLSDATAPALETLLTQRIARLEREILLTLLWAVAGLAFVTLIGVFLIGDVTRPLQTTVGIAQQIAAGDLSTELPEEARRDELGVLLRAFNAMIQSLRAKAAVADQIAAGNLNLDWKPQSERDTLGHSLYKMTTNLRAMTGNINEAVNQISSSAGEILASTSQLSATSAETAAAVTETTTTVEEVRQTAHVSNDKAQFVAQTAQHAAQISHDGREATEGSTLGMGRIREQMDAIAQSMIRLSEQSAAIGEIITSVDDLTQQSNLLAVNAAIEAAKAGEQGKGFGVVAQEVKNLAEQSRQATSQVRSILTDIQKATGAAVMATEQGTKVVEAGSGQTAQSGEAIGRLSASIEEAANAAMQIAASSQQQLIGVDQVAIAMDNVRQASMQNVDSAHQLEAAARDLNALGGHLQDMLARYKM
jgi:methyl-accepting chemotaxis protein